jgi:hypothetical protein
MAAVHDSIIEIMKSLDALPKDGTNPEGWKFRSVETLVRKLQPLFIQHNLISTCEVKEILRESPSRDVKSRTTLVLKYTITSAKDGSSISTECAGEGECLFDKATPKSMTGCWKQAFFQLFMIPVSEDDPDAQTVPPKSTIGQRGASEQHAPANTAAPKTEAGSIDARTVATYRAAIAKFLSLYENHDDDYHEVTVKDGVSTETKETLIQRVDKLKAAILSQPECSAKASLLAELDKLIAKTNRADAKRKEIMERVSALNPASPKQQLDELISWVEREFGGKMIPVVTRDQAVTAIKQIAGA